MTTDSTNNSKQLPLDEKIQSILESLRNRVRGYVIIQGLAVGLIWVGATFWVALGLDYLPVLLGLNEMPWQARAVLLLLIASVLGWILYRWVFRRLFVKLSDQSLALLIERRYRNFSDALITTVEQSKQDSEFQSLRREHGSSAEESSDLLDQTKGRAMSQLDEIEVNEIFNFRPLILSLTGAFILLVAIGVLGVLNSEALAIGSQRIYLLDDEPWPRKVHLEIGGIQVKRDANVSGLDGIQKLIPFENGEVRVTKGSVVELFVRAAESDDANPDRILPRKCTLYFRTQEGETGQQEMLKIGRPVDGYQQYSFGGKPLVGVLSDVTFSIRGGDHRIGDYKIQVVENPIALETKLKWSHPKYLADQDVNRRGVTTASLTPGIGVPTGSLLEFEIESNKPLRRVHISNESTKERMTIESADFLTPNRFTIPKQLLLKDLTLDVIFHDLDGVLSQSPFRISVSAIADNPPDVQATIRGIGSAITPNARIPIAGKILDQYGIQSTWVQLEATGQDSKIVDLEIASSGQVDTAIDFMKLTREEEPIKLVPAAKGQPASQLKLVIRAQDFNDQNTESNVGSGQNYTLDIVSEEEMKRILERLEVGQRRRLEQVYQELLEANQFLIRCRSDGLDASLAEPDDKKSDDSKAETIRDSELRLLFAQRAKLQTSKSLGEILGIAEMFQDIHDQFANNRLDADAAKSRLIQKVVQPLNLICQKTMKELEKRCEALETRLESQLKNNTQVLTEQSDIAADYAIDQMDQTIRELDQVIDALLDFEEFSQILEIVRQMVRDQEELLKNTKKQRQQKSLEDLFK